MTEVSCIQLFPPVIQQGAQCQGIIGVVKFFSLLRVGCWQTVVVQIRIVRINGREVRIPLQQFLTKLCSIYTVNQFLVAAAQSDCQLFHLKTRANVFHGIFDVNLHIAAQLIQQTVTLIPQLQSGIAADIRLPDGFVEITDIFEDVVDFRRILLQLRLIFDLQIFQVLGVLVE